MSRYRQPTDWILRALSFRAATSSPALGVGEVTCARKSGVAFFWKGGQPVKQTRMPSPRAIEIRRMILASSKVVSSPRGRFGPLRPFRHFKGPKGPKGPKGRQWTDSISLPAKYLEDFCLHRGHFFFGEAGIEHLVLRAGPGAAQPQGFLIAGYFRFLKLEPLPPHEEQGQNVAEIDPIRLGLAFERVKAIEQQIVVKPRPSGAFQRRNGAGPKTEGAFRVSGPPIAAVVLAEELAALVKKDA